MSVRLMIFSNTRELSFIFLLQCCGKDSQIVTCSQVARSHRVVRSDYCQGYHGNWELGTSFPEAVPSIIRGCTHVLFRSIIWGRGFVFNL